MRKVFRNDELFPFLSGVVVSLWCTILYEAVTGIRELGTGKLLFMSLATILLAVTTVALMELANEIKDLRTRFNHLKDKKFDEERQGEKKENSGDLIEDLWNRAFRWRADVDIWGKVKQSSTDELADAHVKKIKNKLDWLLGLSIACFLLAMGVLVWVQFI